jgi:hypothetical protein
MASFLLGCLVGLGCFALWRRQSAPTSGVLVAAAVLLVPVAVILVGAGIVVDSTHGAMQTLPAVELAVDTDASPLIALTAIAFFLGGIEVAYLVSLRRHMRRLSADATVG